MHSNKSHIKQIIKIVSKIETSDGSLRIFEISAFKACWISMVAQFLNLELV